MLLGPYNSLFDVLAGGSVPAADLSMCVREIKGTRGTVTPPRLSLQSDYSAGFVLTPGIPVI